MGSWEMQIPMQKEKVEKGVSALLHVMKNKKKKKHTLFPDVAEKVCMQIAAVRIPPPHSHILRIPLKHSLIPDTAEICVFVKDLQKGYKVDNEPAIQYYEELLKKKGITNISKVIPLRQLKAEYKAFETKRKLCNQFDIFLADARILKFLPKFLGKQFFVTKKFPCQVNFEVTNLKKEFQKVLLKTRLPMAHKGGCSMVQVGHSKMSESEIVENIMTTAQVLARKYPGGFQNIRSLHLKLELSMSIPIYVNTVSVNKVHYEMKEIENRTREPITGELSTLNSGYIEVTPEGDLHVKDWHPDEEEEIWIRSDAQGKEKMVQEKEKKKMKKVARKRKGISSEVMEKQTTKKQKAKMSKEATVDVMSSEDMEKQTTKKTKSKMSREATVDVISSEDEDINAAENDYLQRLNEISESKKYVKKDRKKRRKQMHLTEQDDYSNKEDNKMNKKGDVDL